VYGDVVTIDPRLRSDELTFQGDQVVSSAPPGSGRVAAAADRCRSGLQSHGRTVVDQTRTVRRHGLPLHHHCA